MKKSANSLLALVALAGCASTPDIYSLSDIGKVTAVSDSMPYSYQVTSKVPVMVGVATVTLPRTTTFSGTNRVYTLRLLNGVEVTAMSSLILPLGACVELKHSSDLSQLTPSNNFINGVLAAASNCN